MRCRFLPSAWAHTWPVGGEAAVLGGGALGQEGLVGVAVGGREGCPLTPGVGA